MSGLPLKPADYRPGNRGSEDGQHEYKHLQALTEELKPDPTFGSNLQAVMWQNNETGVGLKQSRAPVSGLRSPFTVLRSDVEDN